MAIRRWVLSDYESKVRGGLWWVGVVCDGVVRGWEVEVCGGVVRGRGWERWVVDVLLGGGMCPSDAAWPELMD